MSGQNCTIYTVNINFCNFLFLIRPQQKRVKDHKAMVESLKRWRSDYFWWNYRCSWRVMEDDRIEVTIGEGTKLDNKIHNHKFA